MSERSPIQVVGKKPNGKSRASAGENDEPRYLMTSNDLSSLRVAKMPFNFGTGSIPALGFGTLIPDPAETRTATTNALRVGFRHFDCAERYRNEREVGESLQAEFATGAIAREEVFITTKL
jgi:alcohol dehydrogenase (NADP+)